MKWHFLQKSVECRHLHFPFANMGRVSTSRGIASVVQPLGLKWKGASMWVPTCSLIEMLYWVSNFISLKKANMAHMGNEAVHRVVCPLTDCALPRNIFVSSLIARIYLKGWLPGQILLSSSESGWVRSIRPMVVPKRVVGGLLSVYTFKSTWSHIAAVARWDCEKRREVGF